MDQGVGPAVTITSGSQLLSKAAQEQRDPSPVPLPRGKGMNIPFPRGTFWVCLATIGCTGSRLTTAAFPGNWAVQDWAAHPLLNTRVCA